MGAASCVLMKAEPNSASAVDAINWFLFLRRGGWRHLTSSWDEYL